MLSRIASSEVQKLCIVFVIDSIITLILRKFNQNTEKHAVVVNVSDASQVDNNMSIFFSFLQDKGYTFDKTKYSILD